MPWLKVFVFYLVEGTQHCSMSSGMGPSRRQEFLGLDSVPVVEAGTCTKSMRDVCEVAREGLGRDEDEKKGLQAKAAL